jgi:hypothetical protein
MEICPSNGRELIDDSENSHKELVCSRQIERPPQFSEWIEQLTQFRQNGQQPEKESANSIT